MSLSEEDGFLLSDWFLSRCLPHVVSASFSLHLKFPSLFNFIILHDLCHDFCERYSVKECKMYSWSRLYHGDTVVVFDCINDDGSRAGSAAVSQRPNWLFSFHWCQHGFPSGPLVSTHFPKHASRLTVCNKLPLGVNKRVSEYAQLSALYASYFKSDQIFPLCLAPRASFHLSLRYWTLHLLLSEGECSGAWLWEDGVLSGGARL